MVVLQPSSIPRLVQWCNGRHRETINDRNDEPSDTDTGPNVGTDTNSADTVLESYHQMTLMTVTQELCGLRQHVEFGGWSMSLKINGIPMRPP